jgi:hypothetical protein
MIEGKKSSAVAMSEIFLSHSMIPKKARPGLDPGWMVFGKQNCQSKCASFWLVHFALA